MVARDFSVIVFSLLSASVFASHFRGGLIQWKSVDSNTVGNNVLLMCYAACRKYDQVRIIR